MTADGSRHVIIDGLEHHIIKPAEFDRLVYPDCIVDLPVGAGWATTECAGQRYAVWLPSRMASS